MHMQVRVNSRARRDAAVGRRLLFLVAAVLLAGVAIQVVLLAQASVQSRRITELEKDITTRQANVSNLEHTIEAYHNLDDIEGRATELGMQAPDASQIRVIRVTQTGQDNIVQTASNATGTQITE